MASGKEPHMVAALSQQLRRVKTQTDSTENACAQAEVEDNLHPCDMAALLSMHPEWNFVLWRALTDISSVFDVVRTRKAATQTQSLDNLPSINYSLGTGVMSLRVVSSITIISFTTITDYEQPYTSQALHHGRPRLLHWV